MEALKHLLPDEATQSSSLLNSFTGRGEGVFGSESGVSDWIGGYVRRETCTPGSPAFVSAVGQADLVGEIPARGVVLLGGQPHRVRERHEMLERRKPFSRKHAANRLAGFVERSKDVTDPAGASFEDLLAEGFGFVFREGVAVGCHWARMRWGVFATEALEWVADFE